MIFAINGTIFEYIIISAKKYKQKCFVCKPLSLLGNTEGRQTTVIIVILCLNNKRFYSSVRNEKDKR